MKIIILHGDDENRLFRRFRKFIESAKVRSWEIVYLDESPLSIREQLSFSSLFGNKRFFVLRDIKKLSKKETEWLNKKARDLTGNLIVYNEGYIPVGLLRSLPKDVKIEEFKLPRLIFLFLESLYPGNSKSSIKMFHKIIQKDSPEFVFALASRHFRDLYWARADLKSLPYPNWRVEKLRRQAERFTIVQLRQLISKLAEIDIYVKTSKADLVSELDLLIIKQLE